MKRLFYKILTFMTLAGMALPTTLLSAPQSAYAATPVVSGGNTSDIVNGTGAAYTLTPLTIVSQADGDIAVNANEIQISINSSAALAGVKFDDTSLPIAMGASSNVTLATGAASVTPTQITVPVTVQSTEDDSVTISGIKVLATATGNAVGYKGNAALHATTSGGIDAVSDDGFAVDAQKPTLKSFSSTASVTGSLKVGDSVKFQITPSEQNRSITSDPCNGRALTWQSASSGDAYTATYKVQEGDADVTGLKLTNVKLTDLAGNVNMIASVDTGKTVDASKPQIFGNPTNVVRPDGANIPNEWIVVFQGNTDPGRMVYLTINSNPVEQQTLSTPNGEWRFEVAAKDLGVGEHSATVRTTDAAGNESSYSLKFTVAEPEQTARTYVLASATNVQKPSSIKDSVMPKSISDSKKQELKDEVEKTAEGIINAAETTDEEETNPWQTVVTVLAILIIAVGVGTAGYYAYEWWATRGELLAVSGPAAVVANKTKAKKPATKSKKKAKKSSTGKKSSNRW